MKGIRATPVVVGILMLPFIKTALAQGLPGKGGMPTAQIIANADSYKPLKLTGLAAKLAQQPDMTGTWAIVEPTGSPEGPLFDPEHSRAPRQQPEGEATFGPVPGTRDTAIPYNTEYQNIYDRHIAEAEEGHARDTFAACVPYGVPRMLADNPVFFDIIQAPEVMLWYASYPRTERRVFLDGRPHPQGGGEAFDGGPSYSGHSVGHWEGNVLVIETVDMIPAFFDETAAPHSDKLRVRERLRLIADNYIENEITLDDPIAFVRPWVVKRYYKRLDRLDPAAPSRQHTYLNLNDRPCVPNVRIDENGFQVALLPQEIEQEAKKAQSKTSSK
jgi:hypothetical protein